MAKKIKKPIDVLSQETDEFQWSNFIQNIFNGKYILVLGSEIMLSKEQNQESDGDSTRLIFSSLKEILVEKGELGEKNTATNFTELSRITPEIHKHIRETISDDLDFTIDEMEPNLIELIKTRLFPVVISTTFDPYIELLMREVYGDDLVVMNISNSVSSNSFDYDNYCREDIITLTPPTLYYAFGKAFPKAEKSRFVATDNDAIEVMYKWMSREAPKYFLEFVRSKRILALGCKFDDWFFRFFWYALRGNIQGLSHGEVAISFDENSQIDSSLKTYLEYSNIYCKPDARAFTKEMLDYIKTYKCNEKQTILTKRKSGGVFLSYAHEDFEIVKIIYYKLVENGIPVWFDERSLRDGDKYNPEIEMALSKCVVFIPILSTQVQLDLQKGNNRYYKNTEWSQIQTLINSGSEINVIPLRIWGYDERNADNLAALPACIKDKNVHNLERQPLKELVIRIKDLF